MSTSVLAFRTSSRRSREPMPNSSFSMKRSGVPNCRSARKRAICVHVLIAAEQGTYATLSEPFRTHVSCGHDIPRHHTMKRFEQASTRQWEDLQLRAVDGCVRFFDVSLPLGALPNRAMIGFEIDRATG